MAPGTYLSRRRLVSGHTLQTLALAVAAVDRFGQPPIPFLEQRIAMRLVEAEADRVPLTPAEAELLANFVMLDPWVYRMLLDPANPEGPPAQLCRVCGASEATLGREPFSGLPGRRAHFVTPDLCSLCANAMPVPPPVREAHHQTIEPPFLRLVTTTGEK